MQLGLHKGECEFLIHKNLIWKNNLILRDTHSATYAHIEEDWEKKRMDFSVLVVSVCNCAC